MVAAIQTDQMIIRENLPGGVCKAFTVPLELKEKIESVAAQSVSRKIAPTHTDLYIPGKTNLLTLPLDILDLIVESVKARQSEDREGALSTAVRITAFIPALFYAMASLLTGFIDVSSFFHLTSQFPVGSCGWAAVGAINVLGLVLAGCELVLQTNDLRKELSLFFRLGGFKQDKEAINTSLTYLNDEYINPKTIQVKGEESKKIRKIIANSENLTNISQEQLEKASSLMGKAIEKKSRFLTYRIRPWAFKKLESAAPTLIGQLDNPATLKKAEKLIRLLRIQNQKQILVHTLGILTALSGLLAMALLFTSCPLLIPLALAGLSGSIATAMYLVARGTLDQKGWKFSIADCLPEVVRDFFQKKSLPI